MRHIENWTVPLWQGVIFGQKNMSACSVVDFSIVLKSYARVFTKHHITRAIEHPIGGACGTIIKELIDCFVCALGGGGLLGANGTKVED